MFSILRTLVTVIADLFRSRARLDAEILRLRHQLNLALRRAAPRVRLRLRGPTGARDEFHLAATAQNLRKLAKLISIPNLKPT